MGNAQGTPLKSADEAQMKKYGVFALRSSQVFASDSINDILNELINTNSIFDLEKILTNDTKCKSLFISVFATIRQEFQGLRFPDAQNPGKERRVFFMPKDKYDELVDQDRRKVPCDQITYFIIRLVTLIAAISASIRVNPLLANSTFGLSSPASSAVLQQNKAYRMPAEVSQLVGREPIPEWIVKALVDGKYFTRVMNGTEPDARPLYYFGTYNNVVINTEKSVVFSPLTKDAAGTLSVKETTGLLGITIRPFERGVSRSSSNMRTQYSNPIQLQLQQTVQPHYVQQMPQPMAYPQQSQPQVAVPWSPSPPQEREMSSTSQILPRTQLPTTQFNNISTRRARTRKGRNARKARKSRKARKARKQHGGGPTDSFWEIVVKQVFCAECKDLGKFILDQYGNTYDYEEFKATDGTTMRPRTVLFSERMTTFLNAEPDAKKYKNPEVGAVSAAKAGMYSPIFAREAATIGRFKTIYSTIKESEEGTAPSNYRAFLLASRIVSSPPGIITSFCKDKWAGQPLSSSVAYSLLESLYKSDDLLDGSMGKAEFAGVLARYNGAFADPIGTPTSIDSFQQLKFKEPKTRADLRSICDSSEQQSFSSSTKVNIVTKAHRELRALYDAHVLKCVDLLRRLITFGPEAGYSGRSVLRVSSAFEKDERGTMGLLNFYISDARRFISEHYLRTEQIYAAALAEIGRASVDAASSGIAVSQSSSRTA